MSTSSLTNSAAGSATSGAAGSVNTELGSGAVLQSGPGPRALSPAALSGGFLSSELVTMFRRWRNRALLIALAVIPIALGVALKLTTGSDGGGGNGGGGGGGGSGFVSQVSNNGLFLVFVALTLTLPVFLPMALGVVAGDAISGEAAQGTLRYLLVAPVGRSRLLAAKAISLTVFCFVSSFVVALSAWATGLVLFPLGRVTLLSGDTVSYGYAVLIALLITVVVSLSLLGLGAIGLFVSTLTDTPIAAMAVTVGATILSGILQSIPQLSSIQPWLFTDQWTSFADLLRYPVYTANIVHNLWIQLLYVAVFGSAAWARFSGRDVLS
jgi:ABC-2 type transport system permease protein